MESKTFNNDIYANVSDCEFAYYDWMIHLISDEDHSEEDIVDKYSMVIRGLFLTDFYYKMAMDANRYEDGIDLRYRFGDEMGYEYSVILDCIDYRPCSVLEMMIALAYRCEEQICIDPDAGVNVGRIFWRMMDNLGISNMINGRFDPNYFDLKMKTFMERLYSENGDGNLFAFDLHFLEKNHYKKLRRTEIWYQMHLYLDYIYNNEKGLL